MVAAWYIPQPVIDIANQVSWPLIPAAMYAELANDLTTLILQQRLPMLQREMPTPSEYPKRRVAGDIPQIILDTLGTIDFTLIDAAKVRKLATKLSFAIFTFKRLPKRKV